MFKNKGQVAFVAITLIITFVLFGLGFKSSVKPIEGTKATAFSFQSFQEQQLASLPANLSNNISILNESLARATSPEAKMNTLEELISRWDSLHKPIISATYAMRKAQQEPSLVNWLGAGNRFFEGVVEAMDSLSRSYAVNNAAQSYEAVLQIDSNHLSAKNKLAACYLEGAGNVMSAVMLLKEVEAADSNNVQALFTLGVLSMQSGQYDKALPRFEKLKSLDPFNPEYYYYLAQLYEKSGDLEEAIKSLEICRSLTQDQEQQKILDSKIEELKNS